MVKSVPMVAVVLALSGSVSVASELDDYLDHVREYRMDAMAEMQVETVANILAGYSSVKWEPNEQSGRFWETHESLTCASPDADPELVRREQEARDAKIRTLILGLHDVADLDASGFVTSGEGNEFRSQVLVGYLGNQLADEGPVTFETLGAALGVTGEEVRERLEHYALMYPRFEELGVASSLPLFGAPPVPEIGR